MKSLGIISEGENTLQCIQYKIRQDEIFYYIKGDGFGVLENSEVELIQRE